VKEVLFAPPRWLTIALLCGAVFLLIRGSAFLAEIATQILRLIISSPLLMMSAVFAAGAFILLGLGWRKRRKDMSRRSNDGRADLLIKVGIDPLPWYVGLFQSMKWLPLLVGQHYKVRLTITNNSGEPLRNVGMLLQMWVKKHTSYEASCEPVELELEKLEPNHTTAWYSKKTYLMHDTGGADLELDQAYADGKPSLTFEYQRHASNYYAYAYHVEPWRSAVLEIGISVLPLLVALVALAVALMQR
jgi:hypothetical protein